MVEPFAAVDVIKAKRDGHVLTPEQIDSGGLLLSMLQSAVEISVGRGELDEARRALALFSRLAPKAIGLSVSEAALGHIVASAYEPAFGARPLFEADLLVRVSDESINRAASVDDVLKAIDQALIDANKPDVIAPEPNEPPADGKAVKDQE